MDFGMLPPGIDLPRGEKALDQITKTLAEISPGQLQDVMAGMKVGPDLFSFSLALETYMVKRDLLVELLLASSKSASNHLHSLHDISCRIILN